MRNPSSIVRRAAVLGWLAVAVLIATVGCGGAGAAGSAEAATGGTGTAAGPGDLVARQGTFERRVYLTGSLEAANAIYLQVPRTSNFQVDLRWMEEDGAAVEAGDTVIELDDSAFASDLESKETAFAEKLAELESRSAETLGETRQREFEVTRKRAELEKAELEADVPEGIVPRQDLEERRLARDRARIELETARADLDSYRRASAADLEVLEIDIRKARREIDEARSAIHDLKITAPVSGVFLRGEHPWFGRQLQVGDAAWVGMTLATLPDLSSLVVEARLPDVDDGDVEPGMPALVYLDAYPDREIRGTVRTIAPVAQEEEGLSTRRFFATLVELGGLDAADRARLIPGMSARVEVIADRREDALLVPRRALEPEAGEALRVRLASGDSAEVRLGPCDALDCVVESGIEAGQRLAAAGADEAGAAAGGGR